jgi:hypothetical protein
VTDIDTPPQPIDRAALKPLVRQALGDARAEVVDWRSEPVAFTAVNPLSGGVFRYHGTAMTDGRVQPWSLIHKVIRLPASAGSAAPLGLSATGFEDEASYIYWKREALVYQSGLLADLPEGLTAPRCYVVDEEREDSVHLWLEEIIEAYPEGWPLDRYALAARHLGRLGGMYCARPLPAWLWLSRDWLRDWSVRWASVTERAAQIETSHHPIVREAYAPNDAARLTRLWTARPALLDALVRLPQTLCHRDASRANLIARRRDDGMDETVALDWGFTGIGPAGEDLAQLIAGTLWRFAVPLQGATTLDQAAYAGYLDGLHESGWHGDARAVRLACCAASALLLGFTGPALIPMLDGPGRDATEGLWGRPINELVAHRAALTRFLLDRAEEAYDLLDAL